MILAIDFALFPAREKEISTNTDYLLTYLHVTMFDLKYCRDLGSIFFWREHDF